MHQIPAANSMRPTWTSSSTMMTGAGTLFHMLCGAWLLISLQLLLLGAGAVTPITVNKFPLLMPNVTPTHVSKAAKTVVLHAQFFFGFV